MKRNDLHIPAVLSLLLFLSLSISGCMEAGSADWIGTKPTEQATNEEPSTEETSTETVGEVEGGDKEIENTLPTYVFEEPEPVPEEPVPEPVDEPEPEVVAEEPVAEEPVPEEVPEGENHDISKGGWADDGSWYAEATIGPDYSITATVTASRESLKMETVTEHGAAAKQLGGKIDDARFAYFQKYEDGDKAAAAEDVSDYQDIDEMHNKQMDAIMALSDDIGKLVTQFGITDYDFDHPAENDDDGIIVLDLYSSNSFRFILTVTFEDEESDNISTLEFELDE